LELRHLVIAAEVAHSVVVVGGGRIVAEVVHLESPARTEAVVMGLFAVCWIEAVEEASEVDG